MGKRGRIQHEDIVCEVRSGVRESMLRLGWEGIYIIADDATMARICSQPNLTRARGAMLADMIIGYSGSRAMIEVGECKIGKWGNDTPVIHINWDREVNSLNVDNSNFAIDLSVAIWDTLHGPR